jgi:hypothetical protein
MRYGMARVQLDEDASQPEEVAVGAFDVPVEGESGDEVVDVLLAKQLALGDFEPT